jgi:hypothetical protein
MTIHVAGATGTARADGGKERVAQTQGEEIGWVVTVIGEGEEGTDTAVCVKSCVTERRGREDQTCRALSLDRGQKRAEVSDCLKTLVVQTPDRSDMTGGDFD